MTDLTESLKQNISLLQRQIVRLQTEQNAKYERLLKEEVRELIDCKRELESINITLRDLLNLTQHKDFYAFSSRSFFDDKISNMQKELLEMLKKFA